ncbi:hypothetical protein JCM6882_008525 [Rhodosporidiobolus microsporus]
MPRTSSPHSSEENQSARARKNLAPTIPRRNSPHNDLHLHPVSSRRSAAPPLLRLNLDGLTGSFQLEGPASCPLPDEQLASTLATPSEFFSSTDPFDSSALPTPPQGKKPLLRLDTSPSSLEDIARAVLAQYDVVFHPPAASDLERRPSLHHSHSAPDLSEQAKAARASFDSLTLTPSLSPADLPPAPPLDHRFSSDSTLRESDYLSSTFESLTVQHDAHSASSVSPLSHPDSDNEAFPFPPPCSSAPEVSLPLSFSNLSPFSSSPASSASPVSPSTMAPSVDLPWECKQGEEDGKDGWTGGQVW